MYDGGRVTLFTFQYLRITHSGQDFLDLTTYWDVWNLVLIYNTVIPTSSVFHSFVVLSHLFSWLFVIHSITHLAIGLLIICCILPQFQETCEPLRFCDVIITGDFNAHPRSASCSVISRWVGCGGLNRAYSDTHGCYHRHTHVDWVTWIHVLLRSHSHYRQKHTLV